MKKLRLNSKARKACQGSSRGFSMIEVVIAIALIGVIAVAILSALSTASMALIIADERATAESLARSQLESIKNENYIDYSKPDHGDYVVIEEYPYIIEVFVQPIDPETGEHYLYIEEEGAFEGDDGIQKITVIVSRDDKVVVTLEGYKRGTEEEE